MPKLELESRVDDSLVTLKTAGRRTHEAEIWASTDTNFNNKYAYA